MTAVRKTQQRDTQSVAKAVGDRLRVLREARSLSLRDVAREVSCSSKHLWAVETANVQRPNNELLLRLVDFYEISLDELFGRKDANSSGYIPNTLVERWGRLPRESQKTLLTLMRQLEES